MDRNEIKAIFNNQALGYDAQWKKTAAIKDGLLLFLTAAFADLPENAQILCVGCGTGDEIIYMAKRFPGWRFLALDPSASMLEVCKKKVEAEGFIARCDFHEGYLETVPSISKFDAATSFLVSQFMMDLKFRTDFFREIAIRLNPGGLLASSDLSADVGSSEYDVLLKMWFRMMSQSEISEEGLQRMRAAYKNDVAVLPASQIENIIKAGGFSSCVKFFQAGLIQAWISRV